MDQKQKPLAIRSYGAGKICIEDLTPEEVEILYGSFRAGFHWVRRNDQGRIEHVPSYEQLPPPKVDVEMGPFWGHAGVEGKTTQLELFHGIKNGESFKHSFPSITIQNLCGYNYSPENYKQQADLLKSCGFDCLRSARGLDGKFWEIWFLPSAWSAQGPLKEAIKEIETTEEKERISNRKTKTEIAIEFLRRHASFGTLDVSVQRLAMVIDD